MKKYKKLNRKELILTDLVGVQPLLEGQETPIYRFPGGDNLVSNIELQDVVEW